MTVATHEETRLNALDVDERNLEQIVAGYVSGQLGHGLSAGTAHSEQQGVALGLPQDTADPGDVLDGVQEHDKRHRLLRLCVVVREVLIDGRLRGNIAKMEGKTVKIEDAPCTDGATLATKSRTSSECPRQSHQP